MWRRFIIFVFILEGIGAQNIGMYLSLLDEGKEDQVRNDISLLEKRYPDNSGVLYLKAITAGDGELGIKLFKELIRKYPNSDYADNSALRIGEYLYSRGLYSQASVQLRSVPQKYPKSEVIQPAVDLMVKSYFATGEVDSATIYARFFKKKYPGLDVSNFGLTNLDSPSDVTLVKVEPKEAKKRIREAEKSEPKQQVPVSKEKPWVIQVGAFSQYKNATSLKSTLEEKGYTVEVSQVLSRGRRLHLVRVVRYATKTEAEQVGSRLHDTLGLDYRVMKRPESS